MAKFTDKDGIRRFVVDDPAEFERQMLADREENDRKFIAAQADKAQKGLDKATRRWEDSGGYGSR